MLDKLPEGRDTISSQELARLTGATPSTVRQDFHNFLSKKGKSRVGYDVTTLRKTLVKIMGMHKETRIVVIGSGKLSQALVGYREFHKINISFPAYFDNSETRVNTKLNDIPVYHISELKQFLLKNSDIRMAVLAVPEAEAQAAASYAEQCGIEAIWNFSPVLLDLKEEVAVYNEYIGESLYRLIYEMNQRPKKGGRKMDLMVCVGNSCHLKGAEEVVKRFKALIKEEKMEKNITLKGSFCLGKCSEDGITIQVDDQFDKTTPETVETYFYKSLVPRIRG